jgi:hypothetical protein
LSERTPNKDKILPVHTKIKSGHELLIGLKTKTTEWLTGPQDFEFDFAAVKSLRYTVEREKESEL